MSLDPVAKPMTYDQAQFVAQELWDLASDAERGRTMCAYTKEDVAAFEAVATFLEEWGR